MFHDYQQLMNIRDSNRVTDDPYSSAQPGTNFSRNLLINSDDTDSSARAETSIGTLNELPKTFSNLKRASEPLSKFIQVSAKYGYSF